MTTASYRPVATGIAAAAALALGAPAMAQQGYDEGYDERVYDPVQTTVEGVVPADLSEYPEGPDVEGFISARKGNRMQVTSAGGVKTVVAISDSTEIRSSGGFLGLDRDTLDRASLYNGLPVTAKTVQWGNSLIATSVQLKSKDLKTAAMIARGTEQGFAEQTAATDALRSRVGDIDQYNVKAVTNVYFDTGKWRISEADKAQLCQTASQADAMDNALLLVVGYTDSVGPEEYNQVLSERRAGRVVNYLQQQCGWKPYRMLTPTGMSEFDPAADNMTADGKAQNRRVAVNVLVSKATDGL